MATMSLSNEEGIHILTLTEGDSDNTLTTSVLEEYLAAFEQVEKYSGNTALLMTSEHPKTFSTGINLDWFNDLSTLEMQQFFNLFDDVCLRFATLNCPTVCCLNGNAYAGGAIIPSAADFRIMREDRGRFCFPEVNINIPFTEIMVAVITLIPNRQIIEEMALTGRALTGSECLDHKIVSAVYPLESLQEQAKAMTKELATKDRTTYVRIKSQLRKHIYTLHNQRYSEFARERGC